MRSFIIKYLFIIILPLFFAAGCADNTPPTPAYENNTVYEAETEKTAAPAPATEKNAPTGEIISGPEKSGGFIFIYNGTEIILGAPADSVLPALGLEKDYYEYASCAFDGDSKTYVYNGFELSTYIISGEETDRVYSISFTDDGVETAEGLYIGADVDMIFEAYGEDYEEIPGSYLYFKNGTILSFTADGGVVTVIMYYVEDIYN